VHVGCNHATFVCAERCRRERDDLSAARRDDAAGFMSGDKKWAEEQWKEWVHREHVHSPDDGCRLQGSVNSLNVPGSLRFEIASAWHDIPHEKLNLSHSIHHFSFGKVRQPRSRVRWLAVLAASLSFVFVSSRLTHVPPSIPPSIRPISLFFHAGRARDVGTSRERKAR